MSDLRETLDQLDRRLDDLRHKIATLAEEPRAAAAPGAPARAPEPPASTPHPPPTPEPSPRAPAASPHSGSAEGPSEGDRPKGLDVLFGRAAPPGPEAEIEHEIEPEAEIEPEPASEPEPPPPPEPAPASGQPPEPAPAAEPAPPPGAERVQVAAQIQELIDLRDQLLADSRELVRAYGQKLDTLEQMAAAGLAAVAAVSPGAADESPPAESPPAASWAGEQQGVFFEGTVTLVVSGAHQVQTIEVLEDSLGRASQVEQVYIRRCFQGQVWLELTLSSEVELVDELGRVLPFRFAVISLAGNEIALTPRGWAMTSSERAALQVAQEERSPLSGAPRPEAGSQPSAVSPGRSGPDGRRRAAGSQGQRPPARLHHTRSRPWRRCGIASRAWR